MKVMSKRHILLAKYEIPNRRGVCPYAVGAIQNHTFFFFPAEEGTYPVLHFRDQTRANVQ